MRKTQSSLPPSHPCAGTAPLAAYSPAELRGCVWLQGHGPCARPLLYTGVLWILRLHPLSQPHMCPGNLYFPKSAQASPSSSQGWDPLYSVTLAPACSHSSLHEDRILSHCGESLRATPKTLQASRPPCVQANQPRPRPHLAQPQPAPQRGRGRRAGRRRPGQGRPDPDAGYQGLVGEGVRVVDPLGGAGHVSGLAGAPQRGNNFVMVLAAEQLGLAGVQGDA